MMERPPHSVEQPEQPQQTVNRGFTDAAVSDAAEVSKTLIGGITPADKGWILGFIVVVAIIVGTDMWINIKTIQAQTSNGERTQAYFELVEQHRAEQFDKAMQNWTDQSRRYQEVIRDLTQSISRDSERAGQAAVAAIDDASRQQYIENTKEEPEKVEGR